MFHFIAPGTTVLTRLPPFRFVTSNMTGQALYDTFVNKAEDTETMPTPDPEPVKLRSLVSRHCFLTFECT